MSDQYVFELHFQRQGKSSGDKENQFVIIDGSSMVDFHRLKEDLGLCMPEPFTVMYIDDEEDVISIDTEEEFQEFAKIAKNRCSRGMLMRVILNSNRQLPPAEVKIVQLQSSHQKQAGRDPKPAVDRRSQRYLDLMRFQDKIKAEVKKEILSELKMSESGASAGAASANTNVFGGASSNRESGHMEVESKEAQNEEDAWLSPPEKNPRKTKLMHHCQKKLEKREKLLESKIDQRLEKLEMKKKKLMEKYSQKWFPWEPVFNTKISLPNIMSAIATKESSEISKPVSANEMFTHAWSIVNDGTVTLNDVELRHTWSSPGIEPKKHAVKLEPLLPGQISSIVVKFKAPRTGSTNFISYWHFFRLVDGLWQEFGHYVSVTGTIKHECSGASVSQEASKEREDLETILRMDLKDQEEMKVQNHESNIVLKQQVEQLQLASLASSKIAAEMAEKAARLLAKASAGAESNTAPTAPKPSEGDKLNSQDLEDAAVGVQQLNLVDSESDTDANMETCEDTDRDFVIVNMTSEQQQTSQCETKEKDNSIPVTDDNTKGTQPHPEPLSFPRLDPNVNYPVFPPLRPQVASPPVPAPMFLSQSMIPHNVYNLPVFPPTQTTWSTNAVVFPPPMNYPPNYPIPTPVPLHVNTQPPFVAVSRPPVVTFASQNVSHRLRHNLQSEREIPNVPEMPIAQRTATPTENPAKTVSEPNFPESAPTAETQQVQVQAQPQQQESQPAGATPATHEQNKPSNPVEILPQALVDGAINVAATAYSTAWNALNNLRPKEEITEEFDPVFENNMAMLVEMGFNNLERNGRLLKRFNNDISQVIGVICSTGGGHGLDID